MRCSNGNYNDNALTGLEEIMELAPPHSAVLHVVQMTGQPLPAHAFAPPVYAEALKTGL